MMDDASPPSRAPPASDTTSAAALELSTDVGQSSAVRFDVSAFSPTQDDSLSSLEEIEARTSTKDFSAQTSGSAEELTSPTQRMVDKLAKQPRDRLCNFSRLWIQIAMPTLIVLTIALFGWSNASNGATVVLALSVPDEAKSAVSFTSNVPPVAGQALLIEQGRYSNGTTGTNGNNAIAIPKQFDWIPPSRVALLCLFTSGPMTCLSRAIIHSISNSVDPVNTGHVGINATVPATRDSAPDSVTFDIFNFSLGSSVRHMWEAKAYGLALLIAVLSGAWPYIKLVCMLCLWFIPVKPLLRGRLLSVLEALGKWSLIDIYVFALMMAGFRFELDIGSIVEIKVAIEAKWGIFSFCIGVVISHTLSHGKNTEQRIARGSQWRFEPTQAQAPGLRLPHPFIHDVLVRTHASNQRVVASLPRSLPLSPLVMMFIHHHSQKRMLAYKFDTKPVTLSSVARIRHRKLTIPGQTAIGATILVALGFTVASMLLHTFKFTFSGLVGMMLPPQKRVVEFSLMEAGAYIPSILDDISVGGRIGEYFVVIVYYAFAMVVPILRMISILVLWTVPLTAGQKQTMYTTTSVLGTWSALDVFIVSVIASVMEIGNLTSGIMGETCNSMRDQLGVECLRLDAKLLTGSWVMILAVVFGLIVSRLVLTSALAHFRRLAMLFIMNLKKKLGLQRKQSVEGSEGGATSMPHVSTPRMLTEYVEQVQKNTMSHRLANLLSGGNSFRETSMHDSKIEFT